MKVFRSVKRSVIAIALVAAFGCAALSATPASAQYRTVSINGYYVSDFDLAGIDQTLGFHLPDGHYWYDMSTGYWGEVGGPAIGQIATGGGGGTEPGYNQQTAGGGIMSDGQCSGYLHPGGTTVMTGNC
jgi:hypothetical protein